MIANIASESKRASERCFRCGCVAASKITLANQLCLNLRFRKFESFIEKSYTKKRKREEKLVRARCMHVSGVYEQNRDTPKPRTHNNIKKKQSDKQIDRQMWFDRATDADIPFSTDRRSFSNCVCIFHFCGLFIAKKRRKIDRMPFLHFNSSTYCHGLCKTVSE